MPGRAYYSLLPACLAEGCEGGFFRRRGAGVFAPSLGILLKVLSAGCGGVRINPRTLRLARQDAGQGGGSLLSEGGAKRAALMIGENCAAE